VVANATRCRHTTPSGNAAIAATNIPTPINNWVGIYTKQAPYRTYVVALALPADAAADVLCWDMADPYHYVRLVTPGGRTALLVGGEDHKTGQPGKEEPAARFERLETWARRWFPAAGSAVARWSGQVNEPADGIAFIGRVPTRHHSACYVITGDSGMGLTHGTLGAMLVTDLILRRANSWEHLYSPDRKVLKAPGAFVSENINAATQFSDYLTPGEVSSEDQIPRGQGAIIRRCLKKLAVYRDDHGHVHTRSAICPHLKCIVHWNSLERSWDCPCHGSRFTGTGELITGPSIDNLPEP
jgi:Rieske Fe-S protein